MTEQGVVISEPIYTGDPADAVRELVSEAAEYAGPQDEDTSHNAGIWTAIDAAEEAVRWQPLVVLDTTGGVVQAEYVYSGVGKPKVVVFDLDEPEGDYDGSEHKSLADQLDAAMDIMAKRASEGDDLTAIADYRRQAEELREEGEENAAHYAAHPERVPDYYRELNPEGDPTRNGAFG